jgi:hypothetical protein
MGSDAAMTRYPNEMQSYEKMRLLSRKAGIRYPLP